jgi:hypothetical protein
MPTTSACPVSRDEETVRCGLDILVMLGFVTAILHAFANAILVEEPQPALPLICKLAARHLNG